VSENRVLRKIWKRGWGKLSNEELHDLSSSPGIIRMMKSRRLAWTEYVERMAEKKAFGRKSRRKETTRKTDVGEGIILRRILERQNGVVWAGLIWLRIVTSGRLL
jgi:hypothetical protein